MKAYQAGATSYLTKNEVTEDLGPALRMIHRGTIILSMPPGSPRLQSPPPAAHPRKAALEAELPLRARKLLAGVVAGHANAELSRQLHLSEASAKADLSAMMSILGLLDTGNRFAAGADSRGTQLGVLGTGHAVLCPANPT
jgi:DNA-binding NarL/FixJ family response regulator